MWRVNVPTGDSSPDDYGTRRTDPDLLKEEETPSGGAKPASFLFEFEKFYYKM